MGIDIDNIKPQIFVQIEGVEKSGMWNDTYGPSPNGLWYCKKIATNRYHSGDNPLNGCNVQFISPYWYVSVSFEGFYFNAFRGRNLESLPTNFTNRNENPGWTGGLASCLVADPDIANVDIELEKAFIGAGSQKEFLEFYAVPSGTSRRFARQSDGTCIYIKQL